MRDGGRERERDREREKEGLINASSMQVVIYTQPQGEREMKVVDKMELIMNPR